MTSYDEDLLRSLAKVCNLVSLKFLPISIPLMTAYCDAPGEVNRGDVCVFRGDYHVVYMLVKNDYIDNKISYRLLRGWISNSYFKDRILQKKIALFEQPQDTTIAVSNGWLRDAPG